MATPHEPGTPHYPEDSDLIEARLIEEIVRLRAQFGLDLLGPRSAIALRAASTEALGRQAGRFENLAVLYRRLAVRRGRKQYSSSRCKTAISIRARTGNSHDREASR